MSTPPERKRIDPEATQVYPEGFAETLLASLTEDDLKPSCPFHGPNCTSNPPWDGFSCGAALTEEHPTTPPPVDSPDADPEVTCVDPDETT